jgi:glycosyltransferase involved in cell wall biosynthesis
VTASLDDFVKTKQTSFFVRRLQGVQTRVAAAATRVVVPSEYLKKIVMTWGISSEMISVIYNGVDMPKEVTMPIGERKGFLVVSAGRRVPWKGFEALEQVVAGRSGWHLKIVHGLTQREAWGWITAANVFVLNSRYEGLSHVLLEAMALGTPIVATSVGGNSEVIKNGETGTLIAVGDMVALGNALEDVARNPDAARTRAASAAKQVQDFSSEAMISRTTTLLLSL